MVAPTGTGATQPNPPGAIGPAAPVPLRELLDQPRPLAEIADIARLRAALTQLANALFVLHRAGIVHRDLKPSNVKVTPSGRVVLMDFGIVAELRPQDGTNLDNTLSGTPMYMAPEQLSGGQPSPAADWYAFGVVMYLALTGHSPYGGTTRQIVTAKKTALPPPPPSRWTVGIPEELEALCLRLLSVKPEKRPTGTELLQVFGCLPATEESRARIDARSVFVGRVAELQLLHTRLALARAGQPVCVTIEGASGIGKTCLLDQFQREVVEVVDVVDTDAHRPPPLCLSGSCQERERIPYKAFDGVIDGLSVYLLDLPAERRSALLDGESRVLAQLFPVLLRLPELQVGEHYDHGDPVGTRQRAFAALRELIIRVTRERPVVLRIDDLHWADADSLHLLADLLRAPMIPGLFTLVVLSSKGFADATNAALQRVLTRLMASSTSVHLRLGQFSGREQRELVENIAGSERATVLRESSLWRDSGGHPLLLVELARYIDERSVADASWQELSLEDIIRQRVQRLGQPAQQLLAMVALAGQPIALSAAARACQLGDAVRERAATELATSRLARVTYARAERVIDAEHVKVRAALAETFTPADRRAGHRRLARALEEASEPPWALIAEYWLAADEPERAADYMLRAARGALDQIALDQAMELYRLIPDIYAGRIPGPEGKRAICTARIGLASIMRITDRSTEALLELDLAQSIAEGLDAIEALATIHSLRGSMYFHRGDIEECLAEQRQARSLADRAGSPRLQAKALSGVGDAYFVSGRFLSAYRCYDQCIKLAEDHDMIQVLAANLAARGTMLLFANRLGDALRDGSVGAELAARVGHRRGELVARSGCLSFTLLDMARYDEARVELEASLALSRSLGSRRFEPIILAMLGRLTVEQGQREAGLALLDQGVEVCRDVGFSFVGPPVLAMLAQFTDDPATRERALEQGEELIAKGTHGHNNFFFYRHAMEAQLRAGAHAEVERYAAGLASYTAEREPTPWSQFFIERARTLASYAQGRRGQALRDQLSMLHNEAEKVGLGSAVPMLRAALQDW